MGKIDLHFHTAGHKQGEEGRKFDLLELSQEFKNANIEIAAITNHDYFDEDNFNVFKQYIDKNTMLLRGVELDVLYEENKRHTIIIFDENFTAEEINQFSKKWTNKEFINIIKEIEEKKLYERMIIYPHSYCKDKGFKINEMSQINNYIQKDLSNHLLIWDLPIIKDDFVNAVNEYKNLPSTDAKNLEEYKEKAKDLFSLKSKPRDLKELIKCFKEEKLFIRRMAKSERNISKIDIKIIEGKEEGKKIGTIDINRNLNVIIGRRGTGKTEIINQISEHLRSKSIDYEKITSKDETEYDEIIKELNDNAFATLVNRTNQSLINENCVNYVNNYDDNQIKNFIKMKYEQMSDADLLKTINHLLILNTKTIRNYNDKETGIESLKKIKKQIDDLILLVKDYKYDDISLSAIDTKTLEEYSSSILGKIKEKSIKLTLPSKLATNMLAHIVKRITDHKPIVKSNIKEIGIYRYWSTVWKTNYQQAKQNVENIEIIYNSGEEIKEFETLTRHERLSYVSKFYLPSNIKKADDYNKNQKFFLNINKPLSKKHSKAKVDEKIHFDIYKNPFTIKSNFEEDGEKITPLHNLLVLKSDFKLNGEIKTPSRGQKNLIILDYKLFGNKHLFRKDVIVIDEIENGIENSYITENLNSKIDELILSGKSIFISTHNANVAILHQSINYFYTDDIINHKIYYSNDSKEFVNLIDENDKKPWIDVVLKILEGSKEALNERRKKYGNLID